MEIQSCKYCNVINAGEELNLFDENETERIIKGIFSGKISVKSLDVKSYEKVAEHLTSGVYKGFGKNLVEVEYGTPDFKMLESLRENVYVFSAAKSYQQTKQISSLITTENGTRSFREFKKEAEKVFDTYNKNYLSAEYNSAIAQARSASMWQDFEAQKELYGQLEYHTVGDGRVRQEHRVLDGIIRPVTDKFWDFYMPPNGWNCRCTVLQTDGERNTDLSKKAAPTKKEVPEIFRFNPGKTKQIFNKAHPFFEVSKEDKKLALRNFNLPLPKEIKEIKPIGFIPAKTVTEAEERIINAGVKNVNLKGLKADTANAVSEAVEKEAKFGNFKVDSIVTFRSSGNNGKALYSPSNNTVSINLSHLKAENQILLSYEKQLIETKATLEKFKEEYLGKPQYKQSTVYARMNSFRNRIWEIEQKIKNGETARYWSVSSQFETPNESLKATIIHELGHYRHFKTLNQTNAFNYNKAQSISEYGRTNSKEYFAEWFSHYRLKGEEGVPSDLLSLFKTIDNGK